MIDFSWVWREHFSKIHGAPEEVNYGYCFVWAWIAHVDAHRVTKRPVLLCADDYGHHAFVKTGRLYYDAEHPRGVSDWRKLSTYDLIGEEGLEMKRFRSRASWHNFWQDHVCNRYCSSPCERNQIDRIAREVGWEKVGSLTW